MKSTKFEDKMRPEYDMTRAVRGKYLERFPQDVVMVTLAPDVAAALPDANAANEALHTILNAAKQIVPGA